VIWLGDTGLGLATDGSELDFGAAFFRLKQALAYIFTKKLPWQEGVSESLVQICVILSLIKLPKGPVQEVTRLVCSN